MAPLTLMQEKRVAVGEAFLLQLPNLIAATVLVVAVWCAGKGLVLVIKRISAARKRPDLGALLGSLAHGVVLGMPLLFAAAIVFPSMHPGDVFATLGFGSVAIGFYTSPVVVKTVYENRRDELVVGIGYGDNPPQAVGFFRAGIAAVDGVASTPPVEVIPWALNDSTVDLKVRWWGDSPRLEKVLLRGRVLLAVAQAAKTQGVDLPFPNSVVLLHNQTEEVDGDRTQQREGWPAGKSLLRSRFSRKKESAHGPHN